MNHTFEANGKTWKTNDATIEVLRKFKAEGDDQGIRMVFHCGIALGVIVEVVE